MHVSVTRTKDPLAQPGEVATIVGEEMLRWLEQIDGFEGLLVLSSDTDGTTLVLSFWESAEVAAQHQAARMRLRDRVTATVKVEVEGTSDYEVMFAHLPRVVQSPHAP